MARFRLTPDAQATLREIGVYTTERWGKQHAERYLREIYERFDYLASYPSTGKPRDEFRPGLRSYPQESHVIFYLCEEEGIVITNILHEKMEPERHLR